jgi:hypothetical protein
MKIQILDVSTTFFDCNSKRKLSVRIKMKQEGKEGFYNQAKI